ncbi:MAG: response regulator [Methylobacter sp.]
MPTPLSPSEDPKRNFLSFLGIIAIVIGVSEALALWLLDAAQQWAIISSPWQETVSNIILLTAFSAPQLWFLAIRPLALQIVQEQMTSNREVLDALENHVLVSIADVQGRIVYANDMFCKVSGYSRNELVGQDHRIVNSGHHDKDYIRNVWNTIAGGQVWRGEFCNRRKDGELYWVDSTIAPLLDKTGKPKQYISIRRDTTARKANELKLTALKRALDASSEMILITNEEGRIQYANPALCQFTGWPEDALMGRKPDMLDSHNADPQTLAEMQGRLRCSEAWSGRLRGRRRATTSVSQPENDSQATEDALDYWAKTNITPILAANGSLAGYVQIQHDVSKQVEEEAALQIESDDIAARLTISEALHQSLTLEQRFIQVLDILFGLKGCDSLRKGCMYLRAEGDHYLEKFGVNVNCDCKERVDFGDGLCGQVAVSRKLVVSDLCCCTGDQPHGHYIVPIASGGDILGVLFIFTDTYPVQNESRLAMLNEVGEMMALALLQDKANASLEAARDAALQAAHAKTEFLANMSHEIRTPMNGVLGMLDLLQDTQLSREQWDLIDIAANSAESLLTIINDILDFSKLEAGKVELEQIEFNLPDLVEEVCTLLSSRAHSKGLELNCFLPTNLPQQWHGDPTRIRQVLTNLIGNAIKFTEQGEVSVKVSIIAPGILRFEVTDTGIGISAETQARLFQSFSQADSSTSRRYGGTGLGLSISKDLVALMNGSIGVESALGQGASFWFTLPLLPMANDTPAPQANFSGKRALIVDDNGTNRMILAHHLNNWGVTSSEADNGPAALVELEAAVIRNEPYDILLSDMQMPDMDGFALARAITDKPAIADTPRILLSSGSIGSQAERLESGFKQSLLKPVRQSQLFDAIVDALKLTDQDAVPAHKLKEVVLEYSDKRVLVVEDNKINQKVVLSQFAKFQLKPDLADNGQEALEHLEHQAYDLVFMDCQMPVMDGYEATRLLREREMASACKSHTPVIALTAHASIGERDKCLSAGMDDYLSKPAIRADLAVVLARWLGEPSAPEAARIAHDRAVERERSSLANKDTEESACWDETLALKRLDGDHDLLSEMIDLFLEETPKQLAELEAALSRSDLVALADAAHTIKGMAGHFCAENIISLAVSLERSARTASAGRQSLLHCSTSCIHDSRAQDPGLDSSGEAPAADLKLMVNDLTRAMTNLADNLLRRKEQSHEY